jgi:hypothetical protein
VLALEVGATARDPWQRTFDAANGAHVLASVPSQADATPAATPGSRGSRATRSSELRPIAAAGLDAGDPADGPHGSIQLRRTCHLVAAAAAASVETWEDQRAEALRGAQPIAVLLTTYTLVLLVVVFAVVAILVGARATAQYREIGLLKAVGFTPR